MDKFTKCIELHQNILKMITDKKVKCVQDMTIIINFYSSKTYFDISNNVDFYVKELNAKMLNQYDIYLTFYTGYTSKTLCNYVYIRLKDENYCYCGGYGHHVFSRHWKFHPHWVVKPEFYDIVKLNHYEELALKIHQIDLQINEKAAEERWGN
jgi:hypothetical protein